MTAAAAPRAPYHPDLADLELVTVLHALGDPVRLEIVQALAGRAERPCSDLHGVGGITVATLSHHLRVLREAGLTRTRVSGKHRFLSLRLGELEQRFPGMITSVLRAGAGRRFSRSRAVSRGRRSWRSPGRRACAHGDHLPTCCCGATGLASLRGRARASPQGLSP